MFIISAVPASAGIRSGANCFISTEENLFENGEFIRIGLSDEGPDRQPVKSMTITDEGEESL